MTHANESSDLLVSTEGGVCTVTFNRPQQMNSFTAEMQVRIARLWGDLAENDEVRVVILTGAGDQSFCAGADLKRLVPLISGERKPEDYWDHELASKPRLLDDFLQRVDDFPKPVIAAVNGYAIAGGFELMLSADIRVASRNAVFAQTEVTRGVSPAGGGISRLTRQVGFADAMKLLLTGVKIDAEEALRIGLINEIVVNGDVMARAHEYAKMVLASSRVAVEATKAAVIAASGTPLKQAFLIETLCRAIVMSSEDARTGPRAFVRGETPSFDS